MSPKRGAAAKKGPRKAPGSKAASARAARPRAAAVRPPAAPKVSAPRRSAPPEERAPAPPAERSAAEERAARERAERTADAFRQVSLALGSTLDLDQLLELILQKITEVLEADRATLYLLDERKNRLVSRIVFGDDARSIELPIGEGIAGYVAQTGKSVRVRDAYRDKRFRAEWDKITGYRTQSILAAPMKNHVGRTIGVIQVLNKRVAPEEGFTPHDQELLDALATQAAVSIDNSRLFLSVIQKNMQLVETKELLERRVADLKLLFELESAMGRETNLEGFARAVITKAAAACGAESGALLTSDEESSLALFHVDAHLDMEGGANDGSRPALVRRFTPRRGQGVIGRAMALGEAVSYPEAGVRGALPAEGEAGTPSMRAGVPGLFPETAIAVPLEGEDEQPIGALALYDSQRGGFTQDDRALLRLVSANASTALQLFQSRLERERTERLTSIGRLLSGVMHDMRTPLTVISGYVQLMAATEDPAARAEHARHILKQFDALSAMQREVLEFARGERSILVRKVYLTKFFADVERHLQHELAGHPGVTLEIDLRDRGTARFDEAKITRVLHNLARNAIEAMPLGGALVVRVDRRDDDLVIAVSDAGAGIPREVQERLFQSFVTHGKRGGTGLGLAIVKKIVDEHGGNIAVLTGPGGTTFTVSLPQAGPEAAKVAQRSSKGEAKPRGRPTPPPSPAWPRGGREEREVE